MITIVGGTGFVGTHLTAELKRNNIEFILLAREPNIPKGQNLGQLVYCAGFGGCEQAPFNVLHANTALLSDLLEHCKVERVIYLSSTRLYLGNMSSSESCDLKVLSSDTRKLFNLTKMVAEELIIKSKVPHVILRPSNIYGDALESPLFLPSIVRDSLVKGEVKMFISPEYSKDYVSVFDLVDAIIMTLRNININNISVNIAAGENVSANQIADILIAHTNCNVEWRGQFSDDFFPVTDVKLMTTLFNIRPRRVLEDLPKMIDSFKEKLRK